MPKQAIEAALGHSGSKSCCSEVKAVALANDETGDDHARHHRARERRQARGGGDAEQPADDDEDGLEPAHEVRPGQMLALEHALDHLGVDVDARHRGLERRRTQILERARRRADEHDGALKRFRVERAGKNAPRRDAALRASAGVADPDCPGPAGQRFDGADLDACHAAALAEIGVAACVRGTDHERRGTLCDAQRFRRQARDKLSGDVEDRWQLAHDEVPVGHEIHGAETGRRLAERSERQERAREGRQEGTRIVAGEGEPGLDDRLRAVLGEGHAEHELAAPDRLRKHTVAFRF